ncbi:MAG: hypothetical protein CSA62_04525 [Planctomycetota bacterium]|nr:MAG: hypothetical protein CSA62_04525 [Planctomycetota bacterium]
MSSSRLECLEQGRVKVFVPEAQAPSLPVGFDAPGFRPQGEAATAGRGGSVRLCLADGRGAFYRPYRHGGVLGRLLGAYYRGSGVLEEEMQAGLRLAAGGLRVAPVLAGRAEALALGYRLALLTGECSGPTLLQWLRRAEPSELEPTLRRAGERIAQMQALGFRHADLHPDNLIVMEDGDIAVLDLAGGRFGGSYADVAGRASLVRAGRYLVKRGVPLPIRGVLAFLRGYAQHGGLAVRQLLLELSADLFAALRRRRYGDRETIEALRAMAQRRP